MNSHTGKFSLFIYTTHFLLLVPITDIFGPTSCQAALKTVRREVSGLILGRAYRPSCSDFP